jgi:hypothetical protein
MQRDRQSQRAAMQTDPDRLLQLRANIADRLRRICAAMPEDDFERLVRRIAEIEYKYEQIVESWRVSSGKSEGA